MSSKNIVPLVFISYSHHDKTLCEQLAELLESKIQTRVWYDKALTPGETFRKRIVETIQSADYFIVLLSEDSVSSEWVMDEVEYAKRLHKRILPIYAEETKLPDELDMILQRYHSLFWYLRSSDQQFESTLLQVFDHEEHDKPSAPEREKIFNEFSAEVNRKMQRLVEMEQQGKYSTCYTAENACLLGKSYLFGGLCAIDRRKAHYYFKIAEYFGNQDGTFYLLEMQLEDQQKSTWDEPDKAFCAPIIEKIQNLADSGCMPAIMYLAFILWYGRYGCEKDIRRSAKYFEHCAREGNARAQYTMAANYYEGNGVEKDYELAIMFANLALEQGYLKSWRRWGKFYRDGLAVEQDYEKARRCYEKGAEKGDYNCYNLIGDMVYYGTGFAVDYHEAFSYYQKGERAPEQGQKYSLRRAKQALGRCYELGHGVEANLEMAVQKYLEGYQYGSEECKEAYIRCSSQLLASRQAAPSNERN